MINIQAIASKLNDIDGFKPLFKGIFASIRVMKSFEIYSEASKKGFYALHNLRHAEHEGLQYAVYAFCPDGEIDPDVLQELAGRVANIDIDTLRYECIGYYSLDAWRGDEGSAAAKGDEIIGVMPEHPEILVFPVACDVSCEYVIYAEKDGKHFVYPITEKQAEDIVGQS